MDSFFNWLFNTPVWIQTPLVLIVVIPLCAVATWMVMWIFRLVIPLGDDEQRYAVVGALRKSGDRDGTNRGKGRNDDGSINEGDYAGTPADGETWHSGDAADRL